MSKYFKLRNTPFLLFVVFLISSCANNDTTATNTTTPASTSTAASTDVMPATTTSTNTILPLPGYLDTLWIASSRFDSLPNKNLYLSFRIENSNILTLHGWPCHGLGCVGGFETEPFIKLKNRGASAVPYGPNVYFGNLLITNVKKIKDKAEGYRNVVFLPLPRVDDYIRYRIYVTNDDLTQKIKFLTLTDTEVEANPSPPLH